MAVLQNAIAIRVASRIIRSDRPEVNIYEATKLAMMGHWSARASTPASLIDAMRLNLPVYKQVSSKGSLTNLSIAACIVAKVTRDKMMEESLIRISGYDFAKNAGLGRLSIWLARPTGSDSYSSAFI